MILPVFKTKNHNEKIKTNSFPNFKVCRQLKIINEKRKSNVTSLHKYIKKSLSQNKRKGKKSLNIKNQFKHSKIFKISDFGLCKNVLKKKPEEFGAGNLLAPEICKFGPDSSKVYFCNN